MADCGDTMRSDCAGQLASIREQNREQYKSIERIEKALLGNGRVGLLTRVDRLEQSEAKRCRLLWVLITATTGAIAAGLANLFK